MTGKTDGLIQISGRVHNADDVVATVLAVEPIRFVYRGRSVTIGCADSHVTGRFDRNATLLSLWCCARRAERCDIRLIFDLSIFVTRHNWRQWSSWQGLCLTSCRLKGQNSNRPVCQRATVPLRFWRKTAARPHSHACGFSALRDRHDCHVTMPACLLLECAQTLGSIRNQHWSKRTTHSPL